MPRQRTSRARTGQGQQAKGSGKRWLLFRVQGLGFRVQGVGFRVQGLGFGFRI